MKEFFCILGGGGIRGGAYSGALRALEEEEIKITGWGGSSVGAVVAGLITAGSCPDRIEYIFNNIDLGIFKDISFDFKKGFALSKGGNFYEWIKEKIGPMKFKDSQKELVIFAADVANSKFYEFSKTKTPDVEIAHAIRVSVGMPGLYAPIYNEDECLIDGDLLKSAPLWATCGTINRREERILEFRLENNETKKKISNTFDYFNAVYDTLTGFATDFIIEKYKNYDKYDFIKINLENVSNVDFMINKEKKREMVKKGYNAVRDYFKVQYPKKSAVLYELYAGISGNFNKISYLLKNKDFISARYEIIDIFSKIFDKKEIMDENLLKNFIDFKMVFENNLAIKNGFFRKKYTLAGYEAVLAGAENIKTALNNKIEYFDANKQRLFIK